jgi:hypothetical protein
MNNNIPYNDSDSLYRGAIVANIRVESEVGQLRAGVQTAGSLLPIIGSPWASIVSGGGQSARSNYCHNQS